MSKTNIDSINATAVRHDQLSDLNSAKALHSSFTNAEPFSAMNDQINSAISGYKRFVENGGVSKVVDTINSARALMSSPVIAESLSDVQNRINSALKVYKSFVDSGGLSRARDNINTAQKLLSSPAFEESITSIHERISFILSEYQNFIDSGAVTGVLGSRDSTEALIKSISEAKKISDLYTEDASSLESYGNYGDPNSLSKILRAINESGKKLKSYTSQDKVPTSQDKSVPEEEFDKNQININIVFPSSPAIGDKSTTQNTYVYLVLIFILMQIILPILQNIAANLITPEVQNLISNSAKQKKEQIKDIANIKIRDIRLDQYCFATVDNLVLRESAKAKSKALDNIQFGQVLTVLSKNKNWLEVTYEYEDGTKMHGWVFSRYTQKFKNR